MKLARFFLLAAILVQPVFGNTATGKKGMVASVHPLATDAGVAAFEAGGNAVDAAIATALTLGVVDGHNSGIGGGCFMVIRTADGKVYALDGREMAPAAATRDMYIRDGKGDVTLSQTGALASGVPGSVAVYQHAVEKFGKRKFADLVNPAADLSEKGFPIDRSYARKLNGLAKTIAKFDGSKAILLKEDDTPLAEGDTLKQADLAKTYRGIAKEGADYFYKGEFPKAVETWMKNNGGILTAADFAGYEMKLREPVKTEYRGYTIYGFPPPSSGGTHVAQILNILSNFDLAALQKENEAKRIHVIVEAMKLAFADRAHFLGDPDFVSVPKGLISTTYAAELAKKIDLTKAGEYQHGEPGKFSDELFGKHTTHISACDADGNFCAITQTVNTAFGSKVIIPGTGVIMNNQMDDFSIQPGVPNAFKLIGAEANAVGPKKRPLSSMSPTVVMKGDEPIMAVGAAGGPTIITQSLLCISNVIDLGDDLPTAMARSRFHHQWSPATLRIETSHSPEVLAELEKMGHQLEKVARSGATNSVMKMPDDTFVGVSEPRLNGKAGGN